MHYPFVHQPAKYPIFCLFERAVVVVIGYVVLNLALAIISGKRVDSLILSSISSHIFGSGLFQISAYWLTVLFIGACTAVSHTFFQAVTSSILSGAAHLGVISLVAR